MALFDTGDGRIGPLEFGSTVGLLVKSKPARKHPRPRRPEGFIASRHQVRLVSLYLPRPLLPEAPTNRFLGETFRVLMEMETAKSCEYRSLVIEAWQRLQRGELP